ncbi:MAG: hypothetical protein KF724_11220 [Phycisphaeraceae bacterium]|nr:hypothetical protein [Phycisphaeraceae bacterium]
MRFIRESVVSAFIGGVLVLLPLYLSLLLILKTVDLIGGLLRPITMVLPGWMPQPHLVALAGLLATCVLIGVALRLSIGRVVKERLERWLLERLPGYALFRSLTLRFTGRSRAKEWRPALAEADDGLVPVFIVEELADGWATIFVPGAPTPLSGSVRILPLERLHPVNVSPGHVLRSISQWGSGLGEAFSSMPDRERAMQSVRALRQENAHTAQAAHAHTRPH